VRINVDLDEEEGRKPSAKPNKHTIFIRWTRTVDFSGLEAYLAGQASWSSECIDTVNFMDHVLREGPSQKYTQIKKSFFQRGEQRFDLGGGVEAFKGVFASLRPVLLSNKISDRGLSINVDVANGTFWRSQELLRAVCQVFNCQPPQFIVRLKEAARDWRNSMLRKDLARFKRVGVTAFHNKKALTQWTIEEICPTDATQTTFPDPDEPSRKITIFQYYKTKYNITLTAGLPVVKMTKKIRKGAVYLPIEYLKIDPNQRYNTKLSDKQTSEMIKFAVTLPATRRSHIENGVRLLDWANDPYLLHYGLKVNNAPAKVKARVLPPPSVYFGKKVQIQDRDLVNGRWRLDGKTFAIPNQRELGAWGFCVVQDRRGPAVTKEAAQAFASHFVKIFEGHGGKFNAKLDKLPVLCIGNLQDGGEMIYKAFQQTGNTRNSPPVLMMFVVPDRNVETYRRIKKSCDCRFGVPSQILQARHVQLNSGQYISNVCMKVNAKLGGATTVAQSKVIPMVDKTLPSKSVMVVGADVSHPAPGAGSDEKASFAAITVSKDPTFTRYWAQCNTNGNRVEMVTSQNIYQHLGDMAKSWMEQVGKGQPPERVLYIRDGVSEGQYAAVLEQEVRDMKECFRRNGAKTIPKFTVVIAGKRHHIRFFPEQADRNGNPIPGTLVEAGCTHPFEHDFYLCSHVAIKGTARPIHYQVILDENSWPAPALQSFLFEHSFQYVRSTTPVSLHPAVYYAHLAADRSRAHQNTAAVSSGNKKAQPAQPGQTQQQGQTQSGSGTGQSVEVRPLMEICKTYGLKNFMWYV
jgi:eukaryotic translation initiation factor 2C